MIPDLNDDSNWNQNGSSRSSMSIKKNYGIVEQWYQGGIMHKNNFIIGRSRFTIKS